MAQRRIPAIFMRGGTSKGVFFRAADLPADPVARDRLLLRVTGSPDRYGKQIDGMGAGSSSTSKVVILDRSARPDCDVDYLFGAVAIDRPVIDWSGNCGNLSAAVGPCAIHMGLIAAPPHGMAVLRIWQANIGKKIVAHVPMAGGAVLEEGDFELDGVTFPAAEITLEFLDPADDEGGLFPTGRKIDLLDVPGLGAIEASLVNSGIPSIFIAAGSLGLTGGELPADVNGDPALLARAEAIRAAGAVAMGLAADAQEASVKRPHSPKLTLIAEPASYTASDGKAIDAGSVDLLARTFSMGPLHHAMTGTGAVALATAGAIPGTLVYRTARARPDGRLVFGHPSGQMSVGAEAVEIDGDWRITKVTVGRSARRLMEGWVLAPCSTVT